VIITVFAITVGAVSIILCVILIHEESITRSRTGLDRCDPVAFVVDRPVMVLPSQGLKNKYSQASGGSDAAKILFQISAIV
jgi:hypothetical protein